MMYIYNLQDVYLVLPRKTPSEISSAIYLVLANHLLPVNLSGIISAVEETDLLSMADNMKKPLRNLLSVPSNPLCPPALL